VWAPFAEVTFAFRSSRFHHCSCEIVSLWENVVDRPDSNDSFSPESCICLAHEKTRTVWGIFLHPHTEPAPKHGIKIFLRYFPATLVPSLTLQISDFVQSSLESPTLEFFAYHLPYSRFRWLVLWQREVKLCKVVMLQEYSR
jgi:hypothetical protein